MRWDGLYLYGVVASYAAHLLWMHKQIALSRIVAGHMASVTEAQFWLDVGFVAIYWFVYNIVLFALDEQEPKRRNALLTATLVNGLLFVYTVLMSMGHIFRGSRYLFLFGVGAAYLASEWLARRRQLPTIATVHVLIGLTLMTLAIPLKLTGRWLSFLWTLEVALMAWIGLRYARWTYRAFAMALAFVIFCRLCVVDMWNTRSIEMLGWMIPWRVLMGCIAIGSFGLTAAWYRLKRFQEALNPIESHAFHLYFVAAAILTWMLTALEVNSKWLDTALAFEATGAILLGFWLKDAPVRVIGAIGFGFVGLQLLSTINTWNTWEVSLVVGLLYGISLLYRSSWGERAGAWHNAKHGYSIAASVLLTMLLGLEINKQWLSVAWAVEGLMLVCVGFALRDKIFRIAGLAVFGLLVLKILFVDLAGAETIYRILSFIVAGAILLAASFAYARFETRLIPRQDKS
jgi:uncharacterized membrane protein